jgi:hypothetical protein
LCIGSSAWIGALPPGMRSLYELVKSKGEVTAAVSDLRAGDVELRFRW